MKYVCITGKTISMFIDNNEMNLRVYQTGHIKTIYNVSQLNTLM